jgi:outer membrane immunogenic protein
MAIFCAIIVVRGILVKKLATAIAAIALIGTPAFAADMAVKAPPPPPAPVYSWTGFYAGLNAGWSWGNQDTSVNFPGPSPTTFTFLTPHGPAIDTFFDPIAPVVYQESTHPNGAIGGAQFGYNWQSTSNWIFGVEADFQASGENADGNTHQNAMNGPAIIFGPPFGPPPSGSAAISLTQSISHNDELDWFGTVRGRLGYAIWPTIMLYATGGLAYGQLNKSVSASSAYNFTTTGAPTTASVTFPNGTTVPLPFSASQNFDSSVTRIGWAVGGGIEGAVPNTHVTWKVEYLYMDLGTENFTLNNPLLGTILVNTHFTDNIVRVGLNYQFH